MNKKDFLKKYWFVGLLAVLALIFVGLYSADAYKNREIYIQSKDVDGQSVVYSIDGKYKTADDMFDELYAYYDEGASAAYMAYQRAVLDQAYQTTDDITTLATSYAYNLVSNNTESDIDDLIKPYGFINGSDDAVAFCTFYIKQNQLLTDYFTENYDELVKQTVDETNPRVIFHILVKVADVTEETDENGNVSHTANPTEDEQAKLDKVLAALEAGTDFQTVAYENSDDGSATNGGYLGICDTTFAPDSDSSEKYVQEFYDCAMSLADGEVSDVITTTYGYHIIYNYGGDTQTLLTDSDFIGKLTDLYPVSPLQAIVEKADGLGFVVNDEGLKKFIETALAESED